jgi:hypothetical protein
MCSTINLTSGLGDTPCAAFCQRSTRSSEILCEMPLRAAAFDIRAGLGCSFVAASAMTKSSEQQHIAAGQIRRRMVRKFDSPQATFASAVVRALSK